MGQRSLWSRFRIPLFKNRLKGLQRTLLLCLLSAGAISISHAQEGMVVPEKKEAAGKGKSMNAYISLIRNHSVNDFMKALDYCDEAITEGLRIEDYDNVLIFYNFKKELLKNRNMHYEAVIALRNALEKADQIGNNRFIAKLNLLTGNYFRQIGHPDSSLAYCYTARDHAERTGNPSLIIEANVATGEILTELGNYSQSSSYHNRALKVLDEVRNRREQVNVDEALIYSNIGINYLKAGDFVKSQEYLRKALDKSDGAAYPMTRAGIWIAIGELYMTQGRYQQAVEKYGAAQKELEELYGKTPLRQYSLKLVSCYNRSGYCYYQTGNPVRALELTNRAIALAGSINDLESLRESYLFQSRIYAGQKEFEKAYQVWQGYDSISDSLRGYRTQVDLSKMKLQSQFLEKEFENRSLKEKNIENQSIIKQGIRYLALMGLALLLIVGLGVVGLWLYREKRKGMVLLKQQHEQILEQNQVIVTQKQELEKAFVSLEREHAAGQFELMINQLNPHFLFNSMNVINYLIRKDPEQAIQALTDLSKILKYLLQYKDFQLVTLTEELEMVRAYLNIQNLRHGENLKVHIRVETSDTFSKIPLFSIQLLVENAIKHNIVSGDPPLTIEITVESGWLRVANELNPKVSAVPSTGIGQKNLTERYAHFTDRIPRFRKENNRYIAEIYLIPMRDDGGSDHRG